MVMDQDTCEPVPWLVQECAEDDKVVEAIAVGEPTARTDSESAGAQPPAASSADPAPAPAEVWVSESDHDNGEDSDGAHDGNGGQGPLDDESFMEQLRREAKGLKKSPMKGIYWANSKHSFVVTVRRKVRGQFHVRAKFEQLCLETYVEHLKAARDKAVSHITALQDQELEAGGD